MNGLRRLSWICLSLLVVAGFVVTDVAAASAVEELTRVMPDDTVYFIATSGCDALKDECAKTIFGRMCSDPQVTSFVTQIKNELMTKVGHEDERAEVAQMVQMAMGYGQLLLKRPILIGAARAETVEGPPACFFGILDAGDRKPELEAALAQVEAMIGEDEIGQIDVGALKMHSLKDNDDVPLYWGWVGNYLIVGVNDQQGVATKYLASPRATPTDHLTKVPGHGDVLAVYEDLQQIWQIVQSFAFREGGQDDLIPIKLALDELGVSKIGTIVGRVGISGTDLVSDSFAQVPEPRTGLFAAFKPVDPAILGVVDAQAVTAGVVNVDLGHVYDTVMKTIKAVSPDEGYPEVQEGLAGLESEVGIQLRDGLLKSLAGPVVLYSLPAGRMPEAPMGGLVAMLKLSDAALFEKTVATLGAFVSEKAEGMLQVGSQTDEQGRTIHVWASPVLAFAQVMPTWSVVGDQVVIGSNTALCTMGIRRLASAGQGASSLLDTEGYKKATADLPANLLSLSYIDSQAQFTQMMMQLQQVWPLATMGAMKAGIKLPVMLPNLGAIIKDMQPACEYGYARPDGFYSHYRGTGLEVSLRGVAGGALAAGVLMPSLARTRQLAFRMTSGTNLSSIGKACLIYANDHEDELPPNLEALVTEAELPAQCLESKRKPADFDGPSYVYIAGQTTAMYPGNIVAYEDTRYCTEGVNVLFLDSHVEFMKPGQFRQELKATYERLGREMPEIRFRDE
ncbi:MAG: DUF3352 domain-containing protein [Sedimentisphaerales bacterium]|jgi:prepilin-type processing-associated H-X9-DG protein|nr:DUF3352 domain-containing protein [Sedimentisphaerales bacterium]HNY77515.1 DUF3352 domain-containing protein [Sedimentisphaerales bacterium]HOC62919.1 DUF3352 domain-containing protein [Sedimentisphaerales bacterium]HOH63595.1 DUF3352 domain-containing protein [Sedimentisphaerales bacterium]HPY48628.1 DUF3352 domain-containing protein [Sedimentisphaerales bacterium]